LFMHAKNLCHRDIKPHNILLDPMQHEIKVCDFGSAKKIEKDQGKSVSYICSRHYRAPELIFGSTEYDEKIDIWAAGCVIAEMLRLKPLFPGSST